MSNALSTAGTVSAPAASTSLSSQLSSVLDLISTDPDKPCTVMPATTKSSARELLEAKRVQRQHAEAMNSLFIPFEGAGGDGHQQGGLHLYEEIGQSKIDPPTYWKGTTKKAKDKKLGNGVAYKEKFDAKLSKNRGRQSRLSELKKMY